MLGWTRYFAQELGPRRITVNAVAPGATGTADYYGRIEQQRGPHPSEQMLAAPARGLRLSLDERDHLFQLGGYPSPRRAGSSDHVAAGLMRILDRLADTPAMVVSGAGETLVQTHLRWRSSTPGSESAEKLRLLAVLGRQSLRS